MCQDYLSHERWNQAPKGLGGGGGGENDEALIDAYLLIVYISL